ncbi:MAG: ImmA/IrrE family metallo-endopeptidase, partial [Actinomycetota bacterium]|nr:ImmA/IrrE family metallo-endopeptidase [Actinomycetota bacterium]
QLAIDARPPPDSRIDGPVVASRASVEEIERRAERVLERVPDYVWDGKTLPVPVDQIADSHFGLLVCEMEYLKVAQGAPVVACDQDFSGLLLPDRREIWVNAAEARDWPGRRRFTISHELGHWCMHRDDGGPIYCRQGLIAEAEERPERPLPEREADAFAAALLMPARLMRREYERDRDFGVLCGRFNVSGKAMGRRLHAVI